MVLIELPADTILIQEVEKSSGRVVMTFILSLVGKKNKIFDEITQMSHEIDDARSKIHIEGHQVRRLTRASWDISNDFFTGENIYFLLGQLPKSLIQEQPYHSMLASSHNSTLSM